MNKIVKFLSIILVFILVGCKGDADQSSSHETEIIEDSNGFIDFYKKFHSDSVFQMSHITFPLEGVPSVADTIYDGVSAFHWQKKDWQMHKPVDTNSGEFRREFDMGDVLVTERIINSQNFMLVRRFYYNGSAWNLIYYADLNPVR